MRVAPARGTYQAHDQKDQANAAGSEGAVIAGHAQHVQRYLSRPAPGKAGQRRNSFRRHSGRESTESAEDSSSCRG